MKIEIFNAAGVVNPFVANDLPPFVVLTGLNGSGKTQILKELMSGNGAVDDIREGYQQFKYIPINSFNIQPFEVLTTEQLRLKVMDIFEKFHPPADEVAGVHWESAYSPDSESPEIIRKIAASAKKDVSKLTFSDFIKNYPIEHSNATRDVFKQNFYEVFKRYSDLIITNDRSAFLFHKTGNPIYLYLEDQAFIEKYGRKPWENVNDVMREVGLLYEFIVSEIQDTADPFTVELVDMQTKAIVPIDKLSSGEHVLMSLVNALYFDQFDYKFPYLLLLDEPDSTLHPLMIKNFLSVLQRVFVKNRDVRVIMTTHSPTTVALVPDKSLYMVDRNMPGIQPVTKDKALNVLTTGVPTLSVHYENRRQVFVESVYDRDYYEKIYNKLRELPSTGLISEISLSFISSGDSDLAKTGSIKSNCDQVIKIVRVLREGGNKSVWGIIDWDTTNGEHRQEFVKTHGFGARYNIETYLFDPLLVAALLLDRRLISKEELGINPLDHYTVMANMPNGDLQKISDIVVDKFKKHIKNDYIGYTDVVLMNGLSINIPNWYLFHQGHKLEDDVILKEFPQLNEIKRNKEAELKYYIIDHIIDDLPGLLSIDFLETFKEIQRE